MLPELGRAIQLLLLALHRLRTLKVQRRHVLRGDHRPRVAWLQLHAVHSHLKDWPDSPGERSMTEILVASTVVIALLALGFAAWSLVQTHKEARRRKDRDRAE